MFSKNLSSFASYIIQKSKLKEQISDFYYVLCTHNVSAGGLLDLIVLLGPSPEDVTKQASAALGRCFSMRERGEEISLGFIFPLTGRLATTSVVGVTILWRT